MSRKRNRIDRRGHHFDALESTQMHERSTAASTSDSGGTTWAGFHGRSRDRDTGAKNLRSIEIIAGFTACLDLLIRASDLTRQHCPKQNYRAYEAYTEGFCQ